ncbi:hypothetical protein F0332_020570 [Klebsiella grimontii]|uniref:hypothetical protein n=1 Tax=Klebsiella TaxID=570 RepID=UPI000BF1E0C5|nr:MULTISPECIES: hypothetical protein [Klebsiella]KAA0493947.1 hypothetical protein F0332_04650 [Klebsiella grimontii]PEN25007.1 hypothetical protein CMQ96_07155 [Klebsiella sp. MBT K-1]
MTDITELAQREKFEAWFKSSFHPDKTGPYIKDQLYFAWKAAGAELVEALEKAQRYIEELREWNAGLAQESFERQQRIAELESRTVTVKLPEPTGPMSVGARTVYFGIVADVVGAFQDGLNAAGIKVEAE